MQIFWDTAEFTALLLRTLEIGLNTIRIRVEIPTETERFTTLIQ